jgi:acyl carrier protein
MKANPTRTDIETTLLDAIASYAPTREDVDGSVAVSDLALDSLDLFELGLIVEENWGVELRARDFAALQTVRDVADLIFSRLY